MHRSAIIRRLCRRRVAADAAAGVVVAGMAVLAGITDGAASVGGGVDNQGGTVTLDQSTVSRNDGSVGGGLLAGGGTVTLNDSAVTGNGASEGGGLAVFGGTGTQGGFLWAVV